MPTGYHDSHTPEDIRQLWQTPRYIYDYFNIYHPFACDIAASEVNHLHDRFITAEDNAFNFDFSEFSGQYVWCNPPYRDITPWIQLAERNRNEHQVGTVLLLPADTSVGWFQNIVETADCVYFITEGRLSFVRADTQEPVGGNTKGSIVVVYKPTRFMNYMLDTKYLSRNDIKAFMEERYGQDS